MKSIYVYVIGGILLISNIVLYILFFSSTGCKSSNMSVETYNNDSTSTLPIAYVNIDSVLVNYKFFNDMNNVLMKKQENSRLSLSQKEKTLGKEIKEFQDKIQNNAFLSQERAESEQKRILKLKDEYDKLTQRLSEELMLEQQKVGKQLDDTIKIRIKEFNKNRGYHLILSNTQTSNILYGSVKYDITKDVVDFLNKNYSPAETPAK